MANNYFVRITHSAETLEPLFRNWAPECERWAVYEHEGEKTGKVHCHILMVRCKIHKKQLRNRNCGINLTGNELCSFKELDSAPDSLFHTLTYCSKGNIEPYEFIGFELKEDILKAMKAWVEDMPKAYMIYQQCFKNFGVKHFILVQEEWSKAGYATAFDLEQYDDYVFREEKNKVLDFYMSKFRAYTQACAAQVKMLIITWYYYNKTYTYPKRLERL